MKYEQIGGLATLVQHRGVTTLPGHPPDCSLGSTVLCIHDAGGNGNCFADFMDALASDHSPLALDLPGHGRSGGLDALPSIEAMADHVAGLLDAFGIQRIAVVGEGMGAVVGLELAFARPETVEAMVLVGDVAAVYDVAAEVESLSEITAGRRRREFDRSGYAPETDRAVYQKAFAEWVKTDPRATLGDRRAQAAWNLGNRDDRLTNAVLVIVGEHQEASSVSAANELAAALPSATVESLAGAGRRAVIEQPAALAARAGAFFDAQRTGPST
jgi:pimeloyl-ACP methyl ester carboxylesterase